MNKTEMAIASLMINEPACIPEVLSQLRPEHFTNPVKNLIIEIETMHQQGRGTVSAFLDLLHEKFDMDFILAIMEEYGRTVQSKLSEYIEELQSKRRFEAIQSTIHPLEDIVKSRDKAKLLQVLGNVFHLLQTNRQQNLVQQIIVEVTENAERQKKIFGIPTGFPELDNVLYGLRNGWYYIIAARPSIGKTSLALTIAVNASRKGHTPLIYSLDMPKIDVLKRVYCQTMKTTMYDFEAGIYSQDQLYQFTQVSNYLSENPILFGEARTLEKMFYEIEYLKTTKGVDCVFVDYLQLLRTDQRYSGLYERNTVVSNELKLAAERFNVPVVALSQLSRTIESRKTPKPMLSDLRETGAIEQDADVVLFLYRDEKNIVPEQIEGLIAKNRNGPTEEIRFYFKKEWFAFLNEPTVIDATPF